MKTLKENFFKNVGVGMEAEKQKIRDQLIACFNIINCTTYEITDELEVNFKGNMLMIDGITADMCDKIVFNECEHLKIHHPLFPKKCKSLTLYNMSKDMTIPTDVIDAVSIYNSTFKKLNITGKIDALAIYNSDGIYEIKSKNKMSTLFMLDSACPDKWPNAKQIELNSCTYDDLSDLPNSCTKLKLSNIMGVVFDGLIGTKIEELSIINCIEDKSLDLASHIPDSLKHIVYRKGFNSNLKLPQYLRDVKKMHGKLKIN